MPSMKRLPPFKSIEAFAVAARSRSFTAAAAALNLTVPAVSRRIQTLEVELGTQLFHRTHHELRLTETGKTYVADIAPALDLIRDASERVRTKAHRQSVKLSLPPSFAASWLIPRLSRFQAEHHGIEVELESSIGAVDFDRGDVDLAIRISTDDWPGLHAERLLDIESYPVCSPEFLKDNPPLRRLGNLIKFPLLGSKTRPELWPDWLRAAGVADEPRVRYMFDNFHMLYRAAIDGLGVAIGLDIMAMPYLEEGQLVALFDQRLALAQGIYVVCRPADRSRRPISTFRNWLIAEAARWRRRGHCARTG
jgi:LysR family transcriptional regulator, glycine cleavage system transcriptional activator